MDSSRLLWAACSSLLLAGSVAGQSAVESACNDIEVDFAVPDAQAEPYWSARHPSRTPAVLVPFEDRGQWDASIGTIIKFYEGDVQFFETTNRERYDSLMTRLESFRDELRSVVNPGQSTGVPESADFNIVEQDDGYTVLDTKVLVPSSANADQARSLCYTVRNVMKLNVRLGSWARNASLQELQALSRRWDSFNEAGLTPYPWELLGNRLTGWLGSSDGLDPPDRQLILLRPEVGAEVDRDFGSRQNVVAVELIGAIQYVGSSGWYLGGSFIMTSPSEGAVGFGAMGHVAQWLKFGPIWRDRDDDGDRDFGWLLSIDAYDLLKGPPQQLLSRAQAALEAARQSGGN